MPMVGVEMLQDSHNAIHKIHQVYFTKPSRFSRDLSWVKDVALDFQLGIILDSPVHVSGNSLPHELNWLKRYFNTH